MGVDSKHSLMTNSSEKRPEKVVGREQSRLWFRSHVGRCTPYVSLASFELYILQFLLYFKETFFFFF